MSVHFIGLPRAKDAMALCTQAIARARRAGYIQARCQRAALVGFVVAAAACNNEAISSRRLDRPATGSVFEGVMELKSLVVSFRGQHTTLELDWRSLKRPTEDYHVFIHALSPNGTVVFQGDHPLRDKAQKPTSAWEPHQLVEDRIPLVPPSLLGKGPYDLRVGLYVTNPMRVLQLTRSAFPRPLDGWKNQSVIIRAVVGK